MSDWTADQLAAFTDGDDLHVSPFREDGVTPGSPTWIWSVVVDGALYVRAYNGTGSRWFGAARTQGAGAVTVGGTVYPATYGTAGPFPDAAITAEYERKYAGSPYLHGIIGPRQVAATTRITPREEQE